ncbi:MAG: hypothetical protein IKE75_00560 [Bacilli bacterium]|nr:hypothetical protein [Bacilli bacterium]
MNSQNKNILIGGLLAIVLVMAVGYAAFATQLNITGTASITSNWDVHFNKTAQVSGDVAPAKTFSSGALPSGTITYGSGDKPLTATVHADLNQPGDSVTFTLRIINAGTINATASTPTLTGTGFTISGLTATKGHIRFDVTAPVGKPSGTLLNAGQATTMTVKATFIDTGGETDGSGTTGNMSTESSGTLTISLNYTQA